MRGQDFQGNPVHTTLPVRRLEGLVPTVKEEPTPEPVSQAETGEEQQSIDSKQINVAFPNLMVIGGVNGVLAMLGLLVWFVIRTRARKRETLILEVA